MTTFTESGLAVPFEPDDDDEPFELDEEDDEEEPADEIFRRSIREGLEQFPLRSQVAFAARCAERTQLEISFLLPEHYDSDAVRNAIVMLYEGLDELHVALGGSGLVLAGGEALAEAGVPAGAVS